MVRLTKAQRKDRDRIEAWLEDQPFKENSSDKNPQVPKLGIKELIVDGMYVPEYISDGGKFYTPVKMGDYLWDTVIGNNYITLQKGTMILEPCAGIGNLIYPVLFELREIGVTVHLFELDREAYQIGKRLFPPPFVWTSGTPFDFMNEIEGVYDYVIMNPPINTTWGTMLADGWSQSGGEKSEHLFLECAIRALKPGGRLVCIAPYNYIDRLPKGKGVKGWFEDNAEVVAELGELPGEFQFTGMRVHGFVIERTSELEGAEPEGPHADPVMQAEPEPPEEKKHVTEADVTGFDSAELIEREGSSEDDLDIDIQTSADEPHRRRRRKSEDIADSIRMNMAEATKRAEALSDALKKARKKIPEEDIPEIEDQDPEQLDFLMPTEPPAPKFYAIWTIDELLGHVGHVTYGAPPDAEFIRSIKMWDIREPIILTIDKEGNYRLRDGRRRIKAAIKIGLDEIPVKVYDIDSVAGAALTLDANTQRSANPLSEYEAIVEFRQEALEKGYSVTERDIHYATGMPIQTIRKRMELDLVPQPIIDAVADGKVALGTAQAIAKLSVDQKTTLTNKLKNKGKLIGEDVNEVKRAEQSKGFEQLVQHILEVGPPPKGHKHDFRLELVDGEEQKIFQARCECGRVAHWAEIERTLNVYLD